MPFVSLLRWWYGAGWLDQLQLVRRRLTRTADFFSLGLTARSLFKPFRQIDAEVARKGPIGLVMRTLFDQLFSRVFGAVLRSILILIGLLALVCEVILGFLRMLFWPLVPVSPLVSLPLVMSGWMPWV